MSRVRMVPHGTELSDHGLTQDAALQAIAAHIPKGHTIYLFTPDGIDPMHGSVQLDDHMGATLDYRVEGDVVTLTEA